MNDIKLICSLLGADVDWTKVNLDHIKDLKIKIDDSRRDILLKIFDSELWPESISQSAIVSTPEARRKRASTILTQFIKTSLTGIKFLDYGCGDGDCASAAFDYGAEGFGYDIAKSNEWKNQKGFFSDNIDDIIKKGPYDVIMLYDVVDHMIGSDTRDSFETLNKLLKPSSIIYMRCHPYSSRHGSHLYKTLNKAYAHLFLTEKEITDRGGKSEKTFQIINPDVVYKAMFNYSDLSITSTNKTIVEPENIIKTCLPFISYRWINNNYEDTTIVNILSYQFIDYTVRCM